MEESAEELESKLSAYQGQLQQVHQLLAIDASNEQFTKLKDDLEQVISLTQALLNQVKESGVSQDVQLRKKAKVEDRYSPTAAALEGEDDDQSQAAVEQQQQQLANTPLQIGDHVEVTGGERVFTGVITTIIHETEFQVKYYDFESEVALPLSSLRRIPAGAFKQDDITLGMTCQCRYALDRQYYDVTITGLTQFGYKVTYTEYGNTEEVPIEYLRPTMTLKKSSSTPADINNDYNSTAQSSSNQIAGGKKEKRDANGLIPIPENLKILPTDTEEVTLYITLNTQQIFILYFVLTYRKRNANRKSLKVSRIAIIKSNKNKK